MPEEFSSARTRTKSTPNNGQDNITNAIVDVPRTLKLIIGAYENRVLSQTDRRTDNPILMPSKAIILNRAIR